MITVTSSGKLFCKSFEKHGKNNDNSEECIEKKSEHFYFSF